MIIQAIFSAVDTIKNCPQGSTETKCLTNLPQVEASTNQLQVFFAFVFGIAAGMAVITIAIAGFNFATAGTDSDKISRAKKSIILALIGLVIAASAEIIVLTLLGKI